MIRAPIGKAEYWSKWCEFDSKRADKEWETLNSPSANPVYRPQFAFDTAKGHLKLILRLYSRGDPIRALSPKFGGLLDAWELSNHLSDEICAQQSLKTCRDWTFDLNYLNYYNWCFWLIGLALTLEIHDTQWQRLLALIGGEGEDLLLDTVISSRQPTRTIGRVLLHPRPYVRLLNAMNAPKASQAALLRAFVEHWYGELARKGKDELWWYTYGDSIKNPLEMGSYFGRWCIEAVAAVKAFELDDNLCLGHEHYPGDLLRPEGASTHPMKIESTPGFLRRLFGKSN